MTDSPFWNPGAITINTGPRQTLTVYCVTGLANRLRVLLSGMVVARLTGREFTMLWPRTPHCGALFRELFVNNWPVVDMETIGEPIITSKTTETRRNSVQDYLNDSRKDILIGSTGWIVDCSRKRALEIHKLCGILLRELVPVPELQKRITGFQEKYFKPTMIGVHLRRGDFFLHHPAISLNTSEAINAVNSCLAVNRDAGILLCSDDGTTDYKNRHIVREGVQDLFRNFFGDRVVTTSPRSLNRSQVESVQDALIDLWLLRATDRFVGTKRSSFTYLAVFDRDIEFTLVGKNLAPYHFFYRLVLFIGGARVVRYFNQLWIRRGQLITNTWKNLVTRIRHRGGRI